MIKTINKLCIFGGIQHIPHLCFSPLSFVFGRILIIWMDLDRQAFPRVDVFDQKRKMSERCTVTSKHTVSFCSNIICHRFSRIHSICNNR